MTEGPRESGRERRLGWPQGAHEGAWQRALLQQRGSAAESNYAGTGYRWYCYPVIRSFPAGPFAARHLLDFSGSTAALGFANRGPERAGHDTSLAIRGSLSAVSKPI